MRGTQFKEGVFGHCQHLCRGGRASGGPRILYSCAQLFQLAV
jgi:hypothetical protein